MNRVETEQLLYNAAAAQAIAQGFRLGDGADQQIHAVASNAAQEIDAMPGDEASRQEKLADAVRAFRLLVDTMISVRKDAYRGQPNLLADRVIGEQTLAMSLGKFCPGFWPFC
jgi:hypothetical protein